MKELENWLEFQKQANTQYVVWISDHYVYYSVSIEIGKISEEPFMGCYIWWLPQMELLKNVTN